jgi:hypothetical protein
MFDAEAARKAGYSDKEIADHLSSKSKFDTGAARKAGYTDAELVAHLSKVEPVKPAQTSNVMAAVDRIPGAGVIAGPVEAGAQMLSGMFAKPISDIAGLAAMGYDLARGNKSGDPAGYKKEVQRSLTYEPRTMAGQLTAEYNPLALIGKGVDWVGQQAESNIAGPNAGPFEQGLGAGAREAINQAPQFLGARGVGAGDAIKGSARSLMHSALKPKASMSGKADRAITTMLDEGYNVSPGGVEKLQNRVSDLNSQVKAAIAQSPQKVNKLAAARPLGPLMDRAKRQANPIDDMKAVQGVFNEYIDHPMLVNKAEMPVQLAHDLKTGTYKALGDKSYGELKSASIEAQKALARGLRENIAQKVPTVRPLLAEEANLLNALSVSERRVMVEANKNPLGLGWVSASPMHMAAFMADRSGLFKSLIARMLNTSGNALKDVSGLAGAGISSEANLNKLAEIQ